jgi:hypothetical protein
VNDNLERIRKEAAIRKDRKLGGIEPNVVKWLTRLLHIRKVPDSNLGPQTGYPDRFSWFSSVSPGE